MLASYISFSRIGTFDQYLINLSHQSGHSYLSHIYNSSHVNLHVRILRCQRIQIQPQIYIFPTRSETIATNGRHCNFNSSFLDIIISQEAKQVQL